MAGVATIAETSVNVNNEEQLVTMIVDQQLFGIPILQVQDIVEATKITAVPLSPSAIGGMLNLRGRIVTVIDLRKLLGNDEEVPGDSQMGVTVEHKGDLYTLLVDAIGDVRSVRRSDFDKAPSTLEPATRRLCSGIYRLQGNLLVVLDVSRILTADVIASTAVLTVAERRARKAAALEAAKGDEGQTRQLASHMSGLGGYNAEADRAAADQSADNIKQRKKENRNRRPVAERWREVMDERARRSGQTVYRMREPDEETLSAAHEEMAAEEAAWQSKAKDGAGPVKSGSDGVPGDPGILPDEAFSDEALSDLPVPDDSEFAAGSSDEPVSPTSPPDAALSDEPFSDQPFSDEPAATYDPADSAADDAPPAVDFMASSEGEPVAEDASAGPDAPPAPAATDDPALPADQPEPVAEAAEPVEMKADEAATDDAADLDPADDAAAMPDLPVADEAPGSTAGGAAGGEKSGMLSGFWKKLRTADNNDAAGEVPAADDAPVTDEAAAFDEMPASDEVPAADDQVTAGDEPVADDKPKTAKKKSTKSGGKAKSTAKKKTSTKRKSAKSDKS